VPDEMAENWVGGVVSCRPLEKNGATVPALAVPGDLRANASYKVFYLSATPKAARHAHLPSSKEGRQH